MVEKVVSAVRGVTVVPTHNVTVSERSNFEATAMSIKIEWLIKLFKVSGSQKGSAHLSHLPEKIQQELFHRENLVRCRDKSCLPPSHPLGVVWALCF